MPVQIPHRPPDAFCMVDQFSTIPVGRAGRARADLSVMTRRSALIAKRQAETLTPDEQQELITLSDQIEAANVQRVEALAELARLRNTTLSALILDLGLKPVAHA